MPMADDTTKHGLEAEDSWSLHGERRQQQQQQQQQQNPDESIHGVHLRRRDLKKKKNKQHHHGATVTDDETAQRLEAQRERDFWTNYQAEQEHLDHERQKERDSHNALLKAIYKHPGIAQETVHGIMMDAGSTGTRLHVYEWQPRVLTTPQDITAAVSGELVSFPGTESRWTDRLRPGLAEFASLLHPDNNNDLDETNNSNNTTTKSAPRTPEQIDAQLDQAIGDYLKPLLDFARSVLHEKRSEFNTFPIYLRATAGMRILSASDRARVMASVRRVLHNPTHNPFWFGSDEQARTLSGEEEAIYDWAGINFLVGDLVTQTKGAGAVVHPRPMHGALDLGGGSTQISFFEPSEDIMSNLFKLQIGQAKHWNVYAHSFLFYGMNEAIRRHGARLAAGKSSRERIVDGIYDPCMPKGSKLDIRTNIHLEPDNKTETWQYYNATFPSGNGWYQATLYNDGQSSPEHDMEACFAMAKDLLHLDKNQWCDFAHRGDCSLAGIYQPQLPQQRTEQFGEFIAFSNYYKVWKFLKLPERATLQQLYQATQVACARNLDQLHLAHYKKMDEAELPTYCFRSAYVFELLHEGYGFQLNDTIRVSKVLNGQKVGWALGAMLYEINTLPWSYELASGGDSSSTSSHNPMDSTPTGEWSTSANATSSTNTLVSLLVPTGMGALIVLAVSLVYLLRWQRLRLYRQQYDPVKSGNNNHNETTNLLAVSSSSS